MKILNMVKLHGKPMRCNKASQDKRTLEVGANLFIGNLDQEVDEKLLHDTFSSFGNILSTKVMRDPSVGESRGFGFVAFDSFDSSDAALSAMNGQFLCNRPIHVSYAYKKDTRGERHGSAAERLIAATRPREFPAAPMPSFANALPPITSSILHVPLPPSSSGNFPQPPAPLQHLPPSMPISHGPPPPFPM